MVAVMTSLLFSQGAGDPISGHAGWVGAGLLGLVLAWLLWVHLPAKDKQIKDMIDSRDTLVRDLAVKHDTLVREMTGSHEAFAKSMAVLHESSAKERRDDFKESLKEILSDCKEGRESLGEKMKQGLKDVEQVIVDTRETMEDLREAYLNRPPRKKRNPDEA